jgi:Ca2+-binding RTX toxin-like protein
MDLTFSINGTPDKITVRNSARGSAQQIERVEFADGTVWDLARLNAAPLLGSINNDTLYGRDGPDDYIDGAAGSDTIFGYGGNDTLIGGEGNDTLDGANGNDTLDGGAGNDMLNGGAGGDTYLFGRGDGQDVIDDSDATAGVIDTLRFKAGVSAADVRFGRSLTSNDLTVCLAGSTDTLTIRGWYANGNAKRIERAQFADGTSWDLTTLPNLAQTGGSGDDVLQGSDASADTLIGLAGNDTLNGLNGADTLIGGTGNDILNGGAGNDTYLFGRGDGQDVITDTDATAGNRDTLSFGTAISRDQLWFSRSADDLCVALLGGSDKISIRGWYANPANQIERFQLASGEALLNTQVANLVSAMAAFAPPTAAQQTLPSATATALAPVLAANWK